METFTSTVLVTGGTSGLGFHCSQRIAKQCPTTLVIIAARSDPHEEAAKMNKNNALLNVKFMPLDLGSLSKVRDFVKRWKEQNYPPIQALVLNAGIQLPGHAEYTEDGIEKHFAVHHVGHALLFHLLVPNMNRDARIVITASGVHDVDQKWGLKPDYTTPDEVAHPSLESEKKRSGTDRYATSKVANVLWTKALGRHCSTHRVHYQKTVVAFCPGMMPGTGFLRHGNLIMRGVSKYVGNLLVPVAQTIMRENIHTPTESGENLAWLILGKEVEGMKGVYFEARKEVKVSRQARNETLQQELWKWTIRRVSEDEEERERFEKMESEIKESSGKTLALF